MEYVDGQVTPHFNLYEFRSRDNNTMLVNSATIDHIRRLEKFRIWYSRPMQIDSGYRSPAFNATVGGVEASQHLQGIASDIPLPLEFKEFTAQRKIEFMDNARNKWIEICEADGLGGGFGYYNTFFHLDSRQNQSIFDYRTAPKIEVKVLGNITYIEVNPLSLNYRDLMNAPKSVASLVFENPNFANGPLFLTDPNRPIWLVIKNSIKLYSPKSYDPSTKPKGTIIIYQNGSAQVKTLYNIIDTVNIRLAFQGFNLDYDANGIKPIAHTVLEGQANMNASILKEGYLSDVSRRCLRVGYGYDGSKIFIVNILGTANDLRIAIRALKCIDSKGATCGIGVDGGSRDAFVANSKVVTQGGGLMYNTITF